VSLDRNAEWFLANVTSESSRERETNYHEGRDDKCVKESHESSTDRYYHEHIRIYTIFP